MSRIDRVVTERKTLRRKRTELTDAPEGR